MEELIPKLIEWGSALGLKLIAAVAILIIITISFCSGFFLNAMINKRSNINTKQPDNITTMKKVTGIGGIFFKCKDPDKIKEWYKTHLGFDTDQFGTRFEWQEGADPTRRGSIQWSPFSETANYFNPSTKDFMINYRVENLDKLVKQLKEEGVELIDTIEVYEYGKFVHIIDIEGNKIELYEPNIEYNKAHK